MFSHVLRFVQQLNCVLALAVLALWASTGATLAAPFAAYVMDARTGETIYSKNADTRLHPASLTKMMTLYIAFQAIERGEISLDTMVKVSKHAASEPPSRLGLKPGQKIALRHLIRAAAIKSANDAATAIGEAIGGSEAEFAKRMNRTAKSIGMKNSTFENANGLTRKGHLSTARDMSTLGRRLFYDFPQYYNIFSRRETDAGVADVASTNRRFLDAYKGADGIKTGFTNAAGFNLTASAERNGVRIIATVFGGTSTGQRNAKVAELLDLGFASVKPGKKAKPPAAAPEIEIAPEPEPQLAAVPEPAAPAEPAGEPAAKAVKVAGGLGASPRPRPRPERAPVALAEAAPAGKTKAKAKAAEPAEAEVALVQLDPAEPDGADTLAEQIAAAAAAAQPDDALAAALAEATADLPFQTASATSMALAAPAPTADHVPTVIHTASDGAPAEAVAVPTEPEVVTRISTAGGRHWGVNIGRYASRVGAERALMQTMLSESATLNGSTRKVLAMSGGYDAVFMGLGQDQADLACRRLQARGTGCFTMGP